MWRDAHARSRELALWTGVLAGPVVWLVLLQTNYVLAYVSCEMRQTWFLHLTMAVAAALVCGAGFRAWRAGRGTGAPGMPPPDGAGTPDARRLWMAHAAVALSIGFMVLILAMEVPVVVLSPCQ